MIHPLTEQFYWRLGTIHLTSRHVQIINKHNLQSQQKQITQGTPCNHDRKGNKVMSVQYEPILSCHLYIVICLLRKGVFFTLSSQS